MEHSFIKYLNSLKKFVCSEKAERSFQFYFKYAFGKSFQVYSIWTFVPQIVQQKLNEFNEKKTH